MIENRGGERWPYIYKNAVQQVIKHDDLSKVDSYNIRITYKEHVYFPCIYCTILQKNTFKKLITFSWKYG